MTDKTFSSREICEQTGASYRQLDYWVRSGWLSPSVSEANGSGTKRRYSDTDRHTVVLARSLMVRGMAPKPALDYAVAALHGDNSRFSESVLGFVTAPFLGGNDESV